MTLRRLIDQVLVVTDKQRLNTNMDWDSLVVLANRAAKEVIVQTIPYKDWAYTSQINVGPVSTTLPQNYLKFIRVMLSPTGSAPYYQARYVAVKEFHRLTNWNQAHDYNRSYEKNPIFTIWAQKDIAGNNRLLCLVAPNQLDQTGTAPSWAEYDTSAYQGVMEYHLVPEIVNPTDPIQVPYDYERLLVLKTLERVYQRTDAPMLFEETQRQITEERKRLVDLFLEKRRTEKRDLDSFTEPVIPFVQPQPQPGEAPERLV